MIKCKDCEFMGPNPYNDAIAIGIPGRCGILLPRFVEHSEFLRGITDPAQNGCDLGKRKVLSDVDG